MSRVVEQSTAMHCNKNMEKKRGQKRKTDIVAVASLDLASHPGRQLMVSRYLKKRRPFSRKKTPNSATKIHFSRVSPPGGCHPVRSAPPIPLVTRY